MLSRPLKDRSLPPSPLRARTSDNDMNSNATIKRDFYSDYIQTMLSPLRFDYIHASPVCSTYSYLAGGKHRDNNNYNKTPESHKADELLMKLYFFIAEKLKTNNEMTVTIENPRGWMRYGNIMVRELSTISLSAFTAPTRPHPIRHCRKLQKDLFEKNLGFVRYEIYCESML